MSSVAPLLKVSALTKTFAGAAGELSILKSVDLELAPGDAVAVTGPSGSGKSTLLYIVGLLDTPTSGEVWFEDARPSEWDATKQAQFRNRKIGFVFQDHHLLPQLTVLENVLIPTLVADGAGPAQVARARELLGRVGLAERIDHQPGQLSGGERQRVAVCRALINSPRLLLADEPTGNLDQRTAESVGTLLLEIAREHQTALICVTHSQDLAKRFARRVELLDGRLV